MKDFREMSPSLNSTFDYYEDGTIKSKEEISNDNHNNQLNSKTSYNERGEIQSTENILKDGNNNEVYNQTTNYDYNYWDNGNVKNVSKKDKDREITFNTFYEDGKINTSSMAGNELYKCSYDENKTIFESSGGYKNVTTKHDLGNGNYIKLIESDNCDTEFQVQIQNKDNTVNVYDITGETITQTKLNNEGKPIADIEYDISNMDLYNYDNNGNINLSEGYYRELNPIELNSTRRYLNDYNESNQLIKQTEFYSEDLSDIENWYDCNNNKSLLDTFFNL